MPKPALTGQREASDAAHDHALKAPAISLPKGGGAVKGIGEKFSVNAATGTVSFSVPVFASPGRSGFGPTLSLSYDSGSGNGAFGLGWHLGISSITRKTSKGLPQYRDLDESDVFLISDSEDLVPELTLREGQGLKKECVEDVDGRRYHIRRYRPRIEGTFARIERWRDIASGEMHWRSITRDNVTSLYGRTADARIADPQNPARVFQWMLERSWDDKGNAIVYRYTREELPPGPRRLADRHRSKSHANIYLERILYGNRKPYFVRHHSRDIDCEFDPKAWLFELVFDYTEDAAARYPSNASWSVRQDPFSHYNATFEIRTWRLCHRVLMFHRFDELDPNPCLVRSTDFTYRQNEVATYLTSVTQSGYRWDGRKFDKTSFPEVEFDYEWPRPFQARVEELESASIENLPAGLENGYQLLDLDGEGIAGILVERSGGWYYKRNLGEVRRLRDAGRVAAAPNIAEQSPVRFASTETIADRPSLAVSGKHQFLDLSGNGQIDLVLMDRPAGFFERSTDQSWENFRNFTSFPNIDFDDRNLRFIDVTGDGHADILITEDHAFVWHESFAEHGYGAANRVAKALDEEDGPAVVFAEAEQTVFIADMSGDGLNDIVRIRNGEVCYWPNLGYGQFGAKITMESSPWFDLPDQFDSRRIHLGDLDGSGPADLLYSRHGRVSIWRNQAGNGWQAEETLAIPGLHSLASISVADLLGRGTACVVWSSQGPGDTRPSLRYIDLVGKRKPHLLRRITNNLGAETHLHYASSTKFYLADRLAGRPWITHLPFPVHVCEKVETFDCISKNRFVTSYAFHHGYFDGAEREFRGFGMVEQWDTEAFSALSAGDAFPACTNVDRASHLPPVLTKTWFHTGVFLDRERVSNCYAGLGLDHPGEYYREPGNSDADAKALLLDDTILPEGLTLGERREACRALKGTMLRQEIYALDGSSNEVHPYSVSESNYVVRMLQPRGDNLFAVFLTHARETLEYHYERNPTDPRISHSLTLETDDFGNVLKSVSVGYGRRKLDPDLPARDAHEQTRMLVTCAENTFTNPVLDDAMAYRTPLPAEARTYELTGYTLSHAARRLRTSDFAHAFREIPYEQAPGRGRQRRVIEHVRTYYRPDDFGAAAGDALALLALGDVQSRALAGESYQLAFTPGLLAQIYRRGGDDLLPDPAAVLAADVVGGEVADRGGYVDLDGNGSWWTPSGRMFHSPDRSDDAATEAAHARRHFYLAQRYRDPFGAVTSVAFDSYDLLTVETCDPLGNRVTAGERNAAGDLVSEGNDYRVLQPHLTMDPNRNRTAVAFDALGMVVGIAVMGKPEETLGDTLAGFKTDLSRDVMLAHLADPFADAHHVLASATSRLIVDLFAYARTRALPQLQPPVVYTMVRETHAADLSPGERTRIQHAFSYSDGFGREIQKKIQAEPVRLLGGKRSCDARWVGSGWTIFNNKGKEVRKYEPFFSATHLFEFARLEGVSPVLFYDPLGRVVATLHPDNTYEKVVFDPWRQAVWDASDTVLGDPRSDPDIAGFTEGYFATQSDWQSWYEQRIGGARGERERIAAEKSSAHAATPTVAYFDGLGRVFRSVADNGLAEKYATRTYRDIEGNEREVVDALDRVVMRYDYDMLGHRIHQASMDAGERWTLGDVGKKPIRAWDMRDHAFRNSYDALRRPVESFAREGAGGEIVMSRAIYGESEPDAEANNLRGKAVRLFDQAGIVTTRDYNFKGNPLSSRRELAAEYKTALDWAGDVALEPGAFTAHTHYDALNRPVALIAPDNSVIRPGYNEANLLERVDVDLQGAGEITPFVRNIDYDAKGQRVLIAYGNNAITRYAYDPNTFRLTRLETTRAGFALDDSVVQDLSYTYDPMGNITHIRDDAQQTIYFRHRRVEPSTDYTYDAVHRLIAASGRAHLGQAGGAPKPPSPSDAFDALRTGLAQPGDGDAMGTYVERYAYDAVGNILKMQHRGSDPVNPGWTRHYTYDQPSPLGPAMVNNRLGRTAIGDGTPDIYGYDAHGNMTAMGHLPLMRWDMHDQLQATARQVSAHGTPETTWYVYDSQGQRVRKITERHAAAGHTPARLKERIYIGGFEVYREYGPDGMSVELERQSLHVMADKRRIALVETRTQGDDEGSAQLIRYEFANHLGSASLELDDEARIISYEEYFPYGSTSYRAFANAIETPKRFGFSGKELDRESGLSYFGARYYAGWLVRWISVDPMSHERAEWTPFVYTRNNPVTNSDPNGALDQPAHQGQSESTEADDDEHPGKHVLYGSFRDRVNTRIARWTSKDFREKFDTWQQSKNQYTIKRDKRSETELVDATETYLGCYYESTPKEHSHNIVKYNHIGRTTGLPPPPDPPIDDLEHHQDNSRDKLTHGLNFAWNILVDIGKIAFSIGKLVTGLLIGLGIGAYNIFAKKKLGWGFANRVEDGNSGINLLSWGIGDYNRRSVIGTKINPTGKARIHPEHHALTGVIGKARYHGHGHHRRLLPAGFITIGQEIERRKTYSAVWRIGSHHSGYDLHHRRHHR